MSLEISSGIFSVGVADPDLRYFDIVVPTAFGSSYNAYLVSGEKAVALVETVHEKGETEYFKNVEALCDPAKIDYIILNHTEPDHSGSLKKLLSLAKNAKVVASASALKFLKKITNLEFESITATNALKLDLGGKTLQFIIAPNLHWPDSMFTYVAENQLLFTCDFLGAHYYEENHPLFSKISKPENYKTALKVYFDCIFSPFKKFVLSGLEKIEKLDLQTVCPSHGPILNENISQVAELYRSWSSAESSPQSAVIAYASAYGYTQKLAQIAEATLKAKDYAVKMFDLGVTPPEIAAAKAAQASLILIGSPTFNRSAVLPVWEFVSHLPTVLDSKKKVGVFGSYGWSGEAVPLLVSHLKQLKYDVCGEGFKAVFNPSEAELAAMSAYVETCL